MQPTGQNEAALKHNHATLRALACRIGRENRAQARGERAFPGTSGILDLSRYLDQGYRLLTF